MESHPGDRYIRARAVTEKLHALHRLSHQLRGADRQPSGAFAILGVIDRFGRGSGQSPVRLGTVCRILHRSMPSITRSVNVLEEDGLVTRTASREDRRGVYLSLTDKGRETLRQSCEARFSTIEDMLDRLGEPDTEALLHLLGRLAEVFDQMSTDTSTPEERGPQTP